MFKYLFASLKSFLVSLLLEALKRFGPVPKHVAIIMDGNRRFAKKHRLERASAGHFEGAKTLEKLLDYGFRLGIRTVTVYAFSIENFKRPQEEVDVLMSLAAEKLHQLSQKSDLIKRFKVRINVLGALHLLPKHVQKAAAEAMQETLEHDHDEISRAFALAKKYYLSLPHPDPDSFLSSPHDFSYFLDTWDSPPLDILVRTSGEHRLSEFLLWQVCTGRVQVEILDCLWPEFGFRQLLEIVLRFQRRQGERKQRDLGQTRAGKELFTWRVNQKRDMIKSLIN